MTNTEIKDTFNRAYNGETNFMTPNVIKYGKRGKYIYELSDGDAFMRSGRIYGVTVLTTDGEKTDMGSSFQSKQEAEDYIDQINESNKH